MPGKQFCLGLLLNNSAKRMLGDAGDRLSSRQTSWNERRPSFNTFDNLWLPAGKD